MKKDLAYILERLKKNRDHQKQMNRYYATYQWHYLEPAIERLEQIMAQLNGEREEDDPTPPFYSRSS